MNENLNTYLTISQFAKIYKLNKKTLIYYDEIGLFKPDFINDKGYRFYKIYQASLLEAILFLKKLGMPLNLIKDYMSKRSEDKLYDILIEQKNNLENQIKELNQINLIIKNKINIINKYKDIKTNVIQIENIEKEYLVLSDLVENLEEFSMAKIMCNHISEGYSKGIYRGYGLGAIIKLEQLKNNSFLNYSYFYTRVDKSQKNSKIFIKKNGEYLVTYYKGPWEDFYKVYKNLIQYAEKNNIELEKEAYEEIIFDESSKKSYKQYLTKFMIKIKDQS